MPLIRCCIDAQHLVQGGLLHDADELLLADLTVTITIGLIDHLLELLISHVLTKLLSHTLQVLEGNLACTEKCENK
jgi:hypothetical protein